MNRSVNIGDNTILKFEKPFRIACQRRFCQEWPDGQKIVVCPTADELLKVIQQGDINLLGIQQTALRVKRGN